VRPQIRDVPDPTQALIAAARLGEQQGLRAQLAAIVADRERLSASLAAMTYKVSELESQLAARTAAELTDRYRKVLRCGARHAAFLARASDAAL
jgi:hypothetical protein